MRPREQGSAHGDEGAGGAAGADRPERDRPQRDRPARRKSLAQHHLKESRICRPLVDFLGLGAETLVVEIGPGGGVLTRELLATGARVAAVELDPAWAFRLPKSADRLPRTGGGPSTRLSIAIADALELDWARLPVGVRVAGNLPYNVGTPIVERLLAGAPAATRAAFLLQREVVERMVARPGDDAYGALSLMVALRARAKLLGIVKPGAFVPPPKVDSAFVGLELVESELGAEERAQLERTIRAAFSQRRKTLSNSLGSRFGRETARAALERAEIDARRRAEELELAEFVRLHRALG